MATNAFQHRSQAVSGRIWTFADGEFDETRLFRQQMASSFLVGVSRGNTACLVTAASAQYREMYSVGLELRVGDFPSVFEVEILVGGEFSGGVLL